MGRQMNTDTLPHYLREDSYSQHDLAELQQKPLWKTVDVYEMQLGELFEIDNPHLLRDPEYESLRAAYIAKEKGETPEVRGDWVYLPWSGTLVHMVKEADYNRLRTNRNQNLISKQEQATLSNFSVGVTGLSVGNSIAVGLAYNGISTFHLAEFDRLETANLNRLRSGVHLLGESKLDITAQQIYEINPYAALSTWPEGLREADLPAFLGGDQPLGVVFDEIDDFEMKIRLRIAAREAHVPVLMLTSLGDTILVDVERYDLQPELAIFNGLLGDLPEEILTTEIGEKEKIKYAMQVVGADYVPTRALASLLEINRTLVGRPQLYSTIAAEGGLAGYLVRRLALGWELPSGRWCIAFDTLLDLPKEDDNDRPIILQKLSEMMGPKP
jgi:hypothetical protein